MSDQIFSLETFPAGEPLDAVTLTGRIARHGYTLFLRYELVGRLADIAIPHPAENPARQQGLWEDTCFEVFLGLKDSPQYWEFNLSPSGHWNVYRFADYRQGMQEEAAFASLPFHVQRSANTLKLDLEMNLERIIQEREPLEVGLAAVLELRANWRSYLALTHPAAKPDFHRRDGFTIIL